MLSLRFLHMFGPGDVLSFLSWPVILLLLIAGAVVFLSAKAKRGMPSDAMFERRPLLTKAEMHFAEALEKAVYPRLRVYSQVSLSAIVKVKADNRSTWQSAFNSVSRKYVDFVIVDPITMEVKKVIELDDHSHERQDRQGRDQQLDSILTQAGIPIIHYKAQVAYDPLVLREVIGL